MWIISGAKKVRDGGRAADRLMDFHLSAATRPPYRLIKVQATFIFNLYNDFAKMYLGRAPISQQGFAIQFRTQNTNGTANLFLFIIENRISPLPTCVPVFKKESHSTDSALI